MAVRKAVIPAAGLGTRFLPATKAQPKEMLPIVDTPIIQYVVEEATNSGIEDLLIVTGRGKRAIEDHFDRSFELEYFLRKNGKSEELNGIKDISTLANIYFIRQKEPLGLGHAVLQARRHIGNEPFAVLLGDELFFSHTPALKQVMDYHDQLGGSVVAVREVPRQDVSRYGIVDGKQIGEGIYEVTGLVEKPDPDQAPSNLAIVGRYILEPAIFDILSYLQPGANGEIQLTDALDQLRTTSKVYACTLEATRYDVGEKLGFLQATVEVALARTDLGEGFRHYLTQLFAGSSDSRVEVAATLKTHMK